VNVIVPNAPKIAKAIVAVTAALGVLGVALADGNVDAGEAVQVALAFLGAAGVYRVPNADV
jgi:hypothetical protein